jgi:hypothetical protein
MHCGGLEQGEMAEVEVASHALNAVRGLSHRVGVVAAAAAGYKDTLRRTAASSAAAEGVQQSCIIISHDHDTIEVN